MFMNMNSDNQNSTQGTLEKYLSLLRIIGTIENRLSWSEFTYIFLNLSLILFLTIFISFSSINQYLFSFTGTFSAMACIVIGETLCIYWVISSMRMQLKLKLRYFQARALERKMSINGEYILSEEFIFFDSKSSRIESFDKKDYVDYPAKGTLRMDGFAGSAKPRHLSWILPTLFFLIYWIFFIWILLKIFLT